VEGAVFDAAGKQVAVFSSFHDGMGAFGLSPAAGQQYYALLTKPVAAGRPASVISCRTLNPPA